MTIAAASSRARRRYSQIARDRRRDQSGYTLVEMLVVLAIIGMIVGLVGPRVLNYLADSKTKTAQIQMENVASALDLFYLDAGRYPSTEEGLAALIRRPNDVSSWSGPYLKSAGIPQDPWGHDYIYRAPGQNGPYDIATMGPDGRENSRAATPRNRDASR